MSHLAVSIVNCVLLRTYGLIFFTLSVCNPSQCCLQEPHDFCILFRFRVYEVWKTRTVFMNSKQSCRHTLSVTAKQFISRSKCSELFKKTFVKCRSCLGVIASPKKALTFRLQSAFVERQHNKYEQAFRWEKKHSTNLFSHWTCMTYTNCVVMTTIQSSHHQLDNCWVAQLHYNIVRAIFLTTIREK